MGLFTRKEADAETDNAPARRARARRAAESDAGFDPLDPLQLAKQRARRRLIGAAALVLGAVVLLPMVFDSEPKTSSDDLSVDIPSQNSSFNPPLTAPANPPAAASVTPAQSTLVPGAPGSAPESSKSAMTNPSAGTLAPVPSTLAATATPSASVNAPAVVTQRAPAPVKALDAKVVPPKVATQTPAAPPAAQSAQHDDPRALAALEGKSLAPTSKEERSGETFAVQIGAFSNADKVKDVRDRLQAAGLKPYTESLTTAQGPRTRVRVGPFSTHEAAEEAREKVKGLGFDGSVVTL